MVGVAERVPAVVAEPVDLDWRGHTIYVRVEVCDDAALFGHTVAVDVPPLPKEPGARRRFRRSRGHTYAERAAALFRRHGAEVAGKCWRCGKAACVCRETHVPQEDASAERHAREGE